MWGLRSFFRLRIGRGGGIMKLCFFGYFYGGGGWRARERGSVYTCVRYQETMIISSLKLYSYSYSVALFHADQTH